ncbi:MAG: DUF6055 domain-containing protein, partial [Planctomycetota bacterium]
MRKLNLLIVLPALLMLSTSAQAYTLLTQWGSTSTCGYRTQGGFVVWWDDKFDYYDDAGVILNELIDIQTTCLNDLGMGDPPNILDGYYYNVYIHDPGNDLFPDGWAMGQGTDMYGYPYLTLPVCCHMDMSGVAHEGFHIFQYNATSPGFAYSGDSEWYVEATANWFAADRYPNDIGAYVGASAIKHLPHLPMWATYTNTGISNWQRGMHAYGMNTFLNHLTFECGVTPYFIAHGFYAGTSDLPQKYLYDNIGAANLRQYYADFAVRLAADYDLPFISSAQAVEAESHFSAYGDPSDEFSIVETYNDTGTGGNWVRPSTDYVTRAWAFNVYKINNTQTTSYTFQLDGDPQGSTGTTSYFQGKIAKTDGSTTTYYDLDMTSSQNGNKTINVSSSDTEIYFVVISMPQHFSTNQTYSYQIHIEDSGVPTDLDPPTPDPMTWAQVPAPSPAVVPGISFVPISGDADSGISSANTYTHAIDFGTQPAGGGIATVNGVIFADGGTGAFPPIGGSSQTVGSGSSNIPTSFDGDSGADPYLVDGGMRDLVHDFLWGQPAAVIQLTGLTPGTPYQLRLYHRSWGGVDRSQDIGFDTDGIGADITGAEHTAVFSQDDATQPDPGFGTSTQVYALTYDYVLSPGVTTLTVYVNETGTGTYHLYGLTNEAIVGGDPNTSIGMTATTAADPSGVE